MEDDADARRLRRRQWESRVVRNESSEVTADEDARFWLRIPAHERASVVWELSQELFALASENGSSDERSAMNEDFLDLLSALNAVEARYLVVGGYAVGIHGHPRATKDLDVWAPRMQSSSCRRFAISERLLGI